MKLDESLIPYNAPEEQLLKTNLIVLYDHEQQDDVFIIKNPEKEEIIKISNIKYDDHKNPLNYDLAKYFYFINTDNLIEFDYDDEKTSLCEYFYSLKDFFIECYKLLTEKYENKDGYSDGNEIAFDNFIQNDRCPMHWFYNISNEKGKYLDEKLVKINNSLKDFKTFIQTIKPLYIDSFCDCDSGWSYNLINLSEEKCILGSKRTTFHFIETLDEYYDQMPSIKRAKQEQMEKEYKEWEEKSKNGEIEESIQIPELKTI